VQDGEPPATAMTPTGNSEDAEAVFRRLLADADEDLAKIRTPLAPLHSLAPAVKVEAVADAAWRAAVRPREEAREKLDAAERDLESASLFGRAKAKRGLAAAQAKYALEQETLTAALKAHEIAKQFADLQRWRQTERDKRVRDERASAERRLATNREFTVACLATIRADQKMANAGVEAIEEETRNRIASDAERNKADRTDDYEAPSTEFGGPE